MVNEQSIPKEVYVTGSDGIRYQLVAVPPGAKTRKPRAKKKRKLFKAYGSLYQEDGDKILLLVQHCINKSNDKWGTSDVVRGILTEYLKLLDVEKMGADLIKGCYNT